MMGAKKFTWNTCSHTLRPVSSVPSRVPPVALGEIAALLTSACSSPSSRRLVSAIASSVLSGLDRSTWMWSSGPASHGQFSGNGWREQVMTRQPAAEKRLTVAWPIPRLAPVRSSVRRGWLAGWFGMTVFRTESSRLPGSSEPASRLVGYAWSHFLSENRCPRFRKMLLSRIEARLAPRAVRGVAGEFHALVQAERAVVPELDHHRHDAVAAPVGRARHCADGVFGGIERDRLFQGEAVLERHRLLARPGADLRALGAGREIGVGLGVAHLLDRPAHAHLAPERLPVEHGGSLGVGGQLLALAAQRI